MRWLLALSGLLFVAPTAGRAACTVTANPLAFGVYPPFSGAATNSTGQVQVRCSGGFTGIYTIALNSGLNSGGSFASRKMASGANRLSYQLYRDAARTSVWGDGTGGTSIVSTLCNNNCNDTATVYGSVPALQNVAPGAYVDTVIVTVTY